jgi:hypothetical protein
MTISNEGRALVREFKKVDWDGGSLNLAVRPPLGDDVPSRVYSDHVMTCSKGGSLSLMARDCAKALEAALEKTGGNDEALLEFASAVLTTLRHEMHTAAMVAYPDYLMDWSKRVVAEVNERYKDDERSYTPTGRNEFTLEPNPYDEEEVK